MNKNNFRELFKNHNFRFLFSGEMISSIGDQFTFISLAWLVTRLTGSSIAIGFLLALSGFPRAIFMLISGTIIDRFSPKKIMIISNISRFFIVSTLAILVLTGTLKIWMIYVIALLFGIADAFFLPARVSIVPSIINKEYFGYGNTLIHGLGQLSQFIAPFMVGIFIGYIENTTYGTNGIGFAFIIDAITFLFSLAMLLFISVPLIIPLKDQFTNTVKDRLFSVLKNKGLRYLLLIVAIINFSLVGPFLVGIPLIAKNQLLGVSSYGFIMSAWGVGALSGYFIASLVSRLKKNETFYLFFTSTLLGIIFSLFSIAKNPYHFVIISIFCGIGAGYLMISLLTLIQKNTKQYLMGRTMSLVLFFSIGLNPISELISGIMINTYGNLIFRYAGILIFIVSLIALFSKIINNYDSGIVESA